MRQRWFPMQHNKTCFEQRRAKLIDRLMQPREGETMNLEGQQWIWD